MNEKKAVIKNPFGMKLDNNTEIDFFREDNSGFPKTSGHSGINFAEVQPVSNPNQGVNKFQNSSPDTQIFQPIHTGPVYSQPKSQNIMEPNYNSVGRAGPSPFPINPSNSVPSYPQPNNNNPNFLPGNISLIGQPTYNQNPNYANQDTGEIEEPPLLEDLGINIENIKSKTLSVLTFKKCDEKFINEADMSGPLLLALAFGSLLLLSGKIHFGYIYGFGVCGCFGIYFIMNLLSQTKNIQLYNTVSILGYCLLPIVLLAAISVFICLRGLIGFLSATGAITWATYTATYFFQESLELSHQKWIVAYPVCLFYSTFILITIF